MYFDTSKYLEYLKSTTLGSNLLYLEETSSTNDEVWQHIKNHHHIVVVAERQTKGRGRRNNAWHSLKEKSLTFSIGIQTDKSIASQIPFIIPLSICKAIKKLSQINVGVKWPNDIIVDNKKIAGVLIESKLHKSKQIYNIGIGINVNLNEHDIKSSDIENITSILLKSNKIIDRENLLSEIIISMDEYLLKSQDEIIKLWLENCVHLNMNVQFHNNDKIIVGVFKSIDSTGKALIDVGDNIQSFSSGVIEL